MFPLLLLRLLLPLLPHNPVFRLFMAILLFPHLLFPHLLFPSRRHLPIHISPLLPYRARMLPLPQTYLHHPFQPLDLIPLPRMLLSLH